MEQFALSPADSRLSPGQPFKEDWEEKGDTVRERGKKTCELKRESERERPEKVTEKRGKVKDGEQKN